MKDRISIAILGNVTTDYIGNAIGNECAEYGIEAAIYNCPYMQYHQEILNKESGFYASDPELAILFLEGYQLFPSWYEFSTLTSDVPEKEKQINDILDSLISLIEKIHANSGTIMIINNFKVPYHTPLGILANRMGNNLKHMVAMLNIKLEEYFASSDYAFVFDYCGFSAYIGQINLQDNKMRYLVNTPMSFPSIKQIAKEYMRYILPIKSMNKKCLVLDLDNTLWGGIAGEDGISGVNLDITGTGRSFYDFQKEILNLYRRGVLLAVNSKNNPEDALEIIEEHPHMLLRKEYFSCLKINWRDKASNMKEIADELNIGLDSLAFFDDNPVERDYIRTVLPQVTVIDVPADTSKYCETIINTIEFEILNLTSEDLRRNEMYMQEKKRSELQQVYSAREEYLAGLQTKMVVASADKFTIPRIAQLTQKTNQFNMTTRRYQSPEIEKMSRAADYFVFYCSVSDRFGDGGITGSCIVLLKGREAHIDTLLLSCRALGKNIEYAFLHTVVKILREKGFTRITAEYIRTEKNKVNCNFYLQAGFSIFSMNAGRNIYVIEADADPVNCEYIDVEER